MSLTPDDIARIQAMIDAAAGVGEGFPQPIVAGQQLLIPGIQSPNFSLAGKTGWQILQSGLATFFNLTLSGGTITGPDYILDPTGFFLYSGVPAVGNLILALAPQAENDPLGNPVPQGLLSNQLTLPNQGSAPPAVTGASSLYSSGGGRLKFLSSTGVDAVLDRSTDNAAQFAMGTQTVPTIIGGPLNYRADEGSQSSEYEIEIDGIVTGPTSGAGTIPTYTMTLFLDGASFGAAFTLGTVMFSPITTPVAYSFTVRFRCLLLTSGAGGTAYLSADGQFCQKSANLGNVTAQTAAGSSSGGITKNFDSTVNHTLQVYGNWSAVTSTGHGVVTYRTRISRRD